MIVMHSELSYIFLKVLVGHSFSEIFSEFVLKVLCLPSSNAVFERIFSIINAIKTRSTNRMNFSILDSLLRIRSSFTSMTKCCTEFSPTKAMYDKFNSNIMYSKPENESIPSFGNNYIYDDEDNTIDVFNEITLSESENFY